MKQYNPVTPSLRFMVGPDYSSLSRVSPYKPLLAPIKKTGGRNNKGGITSRHRGGGEKRQYRVVDFKRSLSDVSCKVLSLEYDPNRTAFIALVVYVNGRKSYIVAPQGVKVGDLLITSENADIKNGNFLKLKSIPIGATVSSIELKIGGGAKLVRSAGGSAQLLAKEDGYAFVKLPSGEVRKVHLECRAMIGSISNPDHENRKYGKAGKIRKMGWRPVVRGVAMNPVDHPHGGGEGKSKGGNHPQSPWGQPAKGYKTRRNKRTSSLIISDRRSKL